MSNAKISGNITAENYLRLVKESGLLPPCPPELIVSAHITKAEEQWIRVDIEDTKACCELNEHFEVRNSGERRIKTFEQQKKAASSTLKTSTPLDSDLQ